MSEPNAPAELPYSPALRAGGAVCSFALPGLGQIIQGYVRHDGERFGKGLLFFICLNAMFLFGMWLGLGRNVYVPHQQEQSTEEGKPNIILGWEPSPLVGNVLFTRLQYAGQFWIGLAAWPALWNYYQPDQPILDRYYESPGAIGMRQLDPQAWAHFFVTDDPKENERLAGDKERFLRDIAEKRDEMQRVEKDEPDQTARQWTQMRRQLRAWHLSKCEQELNRLQELPQMGKIWDIAWVYTVIAGVLNILVIYDAWAGPVRLRPTPPGGAETRRQTT